MARNLEIKITADGSQAKRELSSVDTAIEKTTKTTDKLQDSIETLAGRSVPGFDRLSTAVGGFSLGLTAVVTVGAIAFEAIKRLTDGAAHYGSVLNDIAEKNSMTVEATSNLKFAFDVAGASIEQAGNLIFFMQRQMAENPKQFAEGLARINLTLRDLLGLSPDQQLLRIASAFRENTDQTNRAATAVELFTRAGRDAIPLLMKPLDELVKQSRALGFEWTDHEAAAAEQLEMSSRKLRLQWEQLSTNTGRALIPTMSQLYDVLSTLRPAVEAATGAWTETAKAQMLFEQASRTAGAGAQIANQLMSGMTLNIHTQASELPGLVLSVKQQAAAHESVAEALAREKAELAAVQASLTTIDQSYQDLTFQVDNFRREGEQATLEAREYLHEYRDAIQEAVDAEGLLVATTNEFHDAIAITGQELSTVFIPAISELPNVMAQNTTQIHDATEETDHFGQALTDIGTILSHIGGKFADVANIGVRTLQTVMERLAAGDLWGAIIAGVSGAIAIIGKLWGKIKELFGGPSAAELAGREVVDQFEQNLHKMLTAEEQLEAGNDSWKQTVIAVRDAYLKAGLTEAQALIDVKNLWDSSRQGPEAVAAAIKLITDRMNGLTAATNAAGDAIANLPSPPVNTAPTEGQTMHLGGTVLPFVARAHRGLALDEVPIIAQTGEGILNRGAMRRMGGSGALNRMNAGGGFGGVMNQVTVYADGDLNSMAARQKLARTVKQVLDDQVRSTRKLSAR